MIRDARVVGNHRYWLTRTWNPKRPRVTFVGLNPSTADDRQDDATIRKCIGFAKLWDMGELLMLNLWTYRATNPDDLVVADAMLMLVGDRVEEQAAFNLIHPGELVVCAWGATAKSIRGGTQPKRMIGRLLQRKAKVRALHINKDGSPKHPLYVSYGAKLLHYRGVDL